MINKKEEKENGLKETSRLEAFSDGVFSIAITLLVLELIEMLHIQHTEGLLKSYLNNWESFLAFFIGFCTILICWINHHHVFTYINKVDNTLMWINGFVLFAITITPLPTAILAEYLNTEGNTALAMFGVNYFIISLASYSITSYVYKKFLIMEDSRNFFYCITLTYKYGIFYTLLAFIVCFISIPAAIILYLILFGAFASPKKFASLVFKMKNPGKKKSSR